jgi:hypothetical protein
MMRVAIAQCHCGESPATIRVSILDANLICISDFGATALADIDGESDALAALTLMTCVGGGATSARISGVGQGVQCDGDSTFQPTQWYFSIKKNSILVINLRLTGCS